MVQTSIYEKHPHDVFKYKSLSLIDDQIRQFKGAVARYYDSCSRYNNLSFVESKYELRQGNLVQCQNENCNSDLLVNRRRIGYF